jgi:hypothetical protein
MRNRISSRTFSSAEELAQLQQAGGLDRLGAGEHHGGEGAVAAMVLTEARARDHARRPCGASFLATERLAASTAGAGRGCTAFD